MSLLKEHRAKRSSRPLVNGCADEQGIGLVELAIVLPALFTMIFLLFDFVGVIRNDIMLNTIVDNGYRKGMSVWNWNFPSGTQEEEKCGTIGQLTLPGSEPGFPAEIERDVIGALNASNVQFENSEVCVHYGVRDVGTAFAGSTGKAAAPASPGKELFVQVSGYYSGWLLQKQKVTVESVGPALF